MHYLQSGNPQRGIQNPRGTFHLSELAGRTIARPEFLLKNHLPRAYYLGFDWSGLIVLIKREIVICDENGLAGPVLTKRKAKTDLDDFTWSDQTNGEAIGITQWIFLSPPVRNAVLANLYYNVCRSLKIVICVQHWADWYLQIYFSFADVIKERFHFATIVKILSTRDRN